MSEMSLRLCLQAQHPERIHFPSSSCHFFFFFAWQNIYIPPVTWISIWPVCGGIIHLKHRRLIYAAKQHVRLEASLWLHCWCWRDGGGADPAPPRIPPTFHPARSANQTAGVEAEVVKGRGLLRPRPSLPAGWCQAAGMWINRGTHTGGPCSAPVNHSPQNHTQPGGGAAGWAGWEEVGLLDL